MKFIPSYRKSARQKYQEKHPVKVFEGATLTPAQKKIADKVVNSDKRFFVWAAGRQVGKSFTAVQLLCYFSINKPNSVNMFVSMTYNQCLKVFNEYYRGIKDAKIISNYSKSNFEIELKNGSRILFRSYQNVDNCRGYSIKNGGLMCIDEAAFMQDGDFDRIYLPMIQTDRTAKVLLISSPRGCNWFYQYYLRGCKHTAQGLLNKNTLSFKTTYKDNPFCDRQEIEALKMTMPEMIYRQEIEAEFISGASSAFGDSYKNCISYDIPTTPNYMERYFCGIDVGRNDDYTVATIISAVSGEVVEILRVRQKSFNDIANDILLLCKKWKPKAILQEINGIGDPFYEILNNKLQENGINNLQPWTTTNTTKNNIIEALKIAFEEKSIIIPPDNDLIDEIEAFEVNFSSKSHSVVYGARSGQHDDIIMSCALSNYLRRTQAVSGVYGVV